MHGADKDTEDGRCREWFEHLVREHGYELRCFCLRITAGRTSLAEEALQSTFQCAWDRRDRFRGGNARAWLYRIARYEAYNALRRDGHLELMAPEPLRKLLESRRVDAEDHGPSNNEGEQDDEDLLAARRAALMACFSQLEPVDANIVRLSYGLRTCALWGEAPTSPTYQEIAMVLEAETGETFKPDRVRMRLKRALAGLLRCIRQRLLVSAGQASDREKENRL